MASAAQSLGQFDIVGAIKIKDGLFIGDEVAAQDLEFIVANKARVAPPHSYILTA